MECDFGMDGSNTCYLVQTKAIIDDATLKGQLVEKGIGESKGRRLILDLFEVLYLTQKGKFTVLDKKDKPLSERKIMALGEEHDQNFYSKSIVYTDLKEKGYCIKTGLKFGFDFRIYPKGKNMGQAHSEVGIHVASEHEKISMTQISRMTRLAGNIHIKSVIAVVDREDEVNYYSVGRKVF